MTTITHPHLAATTGRPLGFADVLARRSSGPPSRVRPILDPVRADAAAVRRLADSQRRSSPGFAADLYAAADRHEVIHEG